MRLRFPAFIAFAICSSAVAQEHPTYESLRQEMDSRGCVPTEHADYTVFRCAREKAEYYFTKPSHPANPAVIKHFFTPGNANETWWSFGGDSAAMTAWLKHFHRMDTVSVPGR